MNLIKKIQEFKIKLQEDQRMQENFKDCKNTLQQSSSSFLILSFFFIFIFLFLFFLFFLMLMQEFKNN